MKWFFVLVIAFILACGPNYIIKDAETVLDQCKRACVRMEQLKCDNGWQGSPGQDEVYGTDDDEACIDVCVMVEINPEVDFELECVSGADDCSAYEACYLE